MVYNPRDQEWIPNATDNPWANCPGQNPEHEYHIIQTLTWSLQLTNITLSFHVKSESICYYKTRFKCEFERSYRPPNHAIKATVIWQPDNHYSIFDVGRSYARSFIETLENNETNSGHKHNAHMYSSRFQKHLYDESAFCRFEVFAKSLYKSNEYRPYYATQNQDIFV